MNIEPKFTHFHQGTIVVYSGECPFQYRDGVTCPACGGTHICGKGCDAHLVRALGVPNGN